MKLKRPDCRALVSDVGGPKEFVDDGLTGRVLPAGDASTWANAALELLSDEPRRLRMSRTAVVRMARCGPTRTFDSYWDAHLAAALANQKKHAAVVNAPARHYDADLCRGDVMSIRVLILSASVGSGHNRAAEAIELAMREQSPDAAIDRLDVLELASPLFRRCYSHGYFKLIAKAARIWSDIFTIDSISR